MPHRVKAKMKKLELTRVSKYFGDQLVLDGLSLDVYPGELIAVLGSSGVGKSTLVRTLAGFEAIDGGEIYLDGNLIASKDSEVPAEKRGITIVPQTASLFPHLTVSQNIAFGIDKNNTERVAELLKLTRLEELADRMPESLSGGQQQRVSLARALAPKPKMILLDEPFSALDPELRDQLRNDVRRVIKAEGATALLVTHDQEEALSIADRVAVMRDGVFAQIGDPIEIYSAPADVGVATFLGDSVIIEGRVQDGKVVTDLGNLNPLNNVTEGERGRVAIRPENFYLQPNPKAENFVIGRTFFGHDALLEVQTPKLRIKARSNGPFAPEIGMPVTVWVRGAVNFYADGN
jgi:iron(III) transport system ATP-binding protein